MDKITADFIKRALSKRHITDYFATEVKTGPTWYQKGSLGIVDAMAIRKSWTKPCVTFYEVKVSHSDFINDEKWIRYLDHCNKFYFVCPRGVISRQEADAKAGLITVNKEGGMRILKGCPMFANELSFDLLYYLIMNKLESDRHPFFSTAREELEAWVADKEERQRLGYHVRTKLVREREEACEKAKEAESKLDKLQRTVADFKEGLQEFDISTDSWRISWREQLRNKLEANIPITEAKLLRDTARNIVEKTERLLSQVCDEKTIQTS